MESTDDDRSLIAVGAGNLVSRQQDNAGIPVVAIDAEVHAPLTHLLVVDDIRSPHHTVNRIIAAAALRPVERTEGKSTSLPSFFTLVT